MHQIENEFLKLRAREYGAELTSVIYKKTKTEHLWQADEKVWGWHAPVLFPVVGRCLNDEIILKGVKYPMQKHGFARKSNFRLLDLGDSKMVFSLKSSEETLKMYPCKFEFLIGYRIRKNQLYISYEVINEDKEPIYFQLGGHPAFAVPFHPAENYQDYFIEFETIENSERHLINPGGFFDGRREPVLHNSNRVQLKNDLFANDALIFKDLKSRKVTLRSNTHLYFIEMDFKGFSYLGIWAKENAPFVCIEPWLGCAETVGEPREFSLRENVVMLEPGEEFNPSFTLTFG